MNNRMHIIIPIVGLLLVMGISILIPLMSRDKGVAIEVALEDMAETEPLPDAAAGEMSLQSDPIPIETVQQVQDTFISQPDEHIRFISFEEAVNDSHITVDAEDVESLNDAGMYYYSNGEYEYAAALFYAGTLLDGATEDAKQLAYCYYNLACTISLLYGTDENYSNLDECLHYLERSFELREDRIARAKEDKDFDNIRNMQAFRDLMEAWQDDRQGEDNE